MKRFFGRERFLKLLRDWIIFYKRDDELRKIVLRQHQTRAVEKVVERALDPEKRHGLVWHTQGSGKTFTMITAAEQILDHPALRNEKPTVLMLVDRNELEGQLFQNLNAYGLPYEQATSKKRLRELLKNDYRGLIVSMIHKFEGADANLSTRENVFVLVDEAHRTTGGDLGNYLVAALPNATIIGFTGTPIDKTAYGKGTFKVFGVDDPKGYLDKYSIAESIADGTTLPLHYTLAPSEMLVPEEQLEKEFLALTETEGVSDIEELNKILDRAVSLKTFLKAPDRVEKVAAFVAEHFRENVEPLGYKAFLVGVDREACALYKQALDKHLPPEYSAVVYTSAHNDPELLTEFKLDEDAEKQIRKAFTKSEKLPKILIVTEKLLTGFDAPILYCMYLDKPMRDHTLLQAIARVNRPYEEDGSVKKPAGFVLDFVGIFENLQKALSFDSDMVASVIQNIDVLKQRFESLMATQAPAYLEYSGGWVDDKAVERAIEGFSDKERREVFYSFFKELETLYEIISPDAFLRPLLDDYLDLMRLYALVRGAFGSGVPLLEDVRKKTASLVREHAVLEGLTGNLEPVRLDEEALAALKSKQGSQKAKVINLGRTIIKQIKDAPMQPYLIEIKDRAEDVLERLDDRQTETEQALAELEAIVRDYQEIGKERERLNLDTTTFAFFQTLKQAGSRACRRAGVGDGHQCTVRALSRTARQRRTEARSQGRVVQRTAPEDRERQDGEDRRSASRRGGVTVPRRSRKISRKLFHDDVREWAARVGVTPTRVQVQPLTRKWASCSTAGRLTFSADLLSQPPRFRDEVIVHELVHLIAANHGKLFKSLMRAHLGSAVASERIASCRMQTDG